MLFITASSNQSDERVVGYEFVDDEILHFWNEYDDYYLNMTSGIQFSNHYDEYWTHNTFCAGYKTTIWNYKCSDDLPIQLTVYSDNETYVQINGTRVIEIAGRNIGMGIDYYLGSNYTELNITTGLKHLSGNPITNDLAFAWRTNQINIDGDVENDRIFVNNTFYNLNESLDLMFKNMTKQISNNNVTWNGNCPNDCLDEVYNHEHPEICVDCHDVNIYHTYNQIPYYNLLDDSFVSLRWNPNLNYFLQVKNTSQYNSPVTLAIVTDGLNVGQTKKTTFNWRDPTSVALVGTPEHAFKDTLSYTAETGSNRVVIISINYEDDGGSIDDDPSTVRMGTQDATKIVSDHIGSSYVAAVSLWRIMEADIPAGANNVVCTWPGLTPSEHHTLAATYSGVDQTTPINDTGINSTTSLSTLTISDLVVDVGGYGVGSTTSGNKYHFTPQNSYVEQMDVLLETDATATATYIDKAEASAGTTTPSANFPYTVNRQVMVGFTLNPYSDVGDSCTCTDNENWEIDMSDNCELSVDCNPFNVTFINTGNFYCNATLNVTSVEGLSSGQVGYMGSSCVVVDN